MATYFQSFWSSSMPKRLLRYVLLKLDYLDADALDLDSFDLVWGRNNQVTFQDVGIKIQKLEQLLQLPPSIQIQKAKILVLRVTVPSAIATSPIIVEADGVEVKLKVTSPGESKAPPKKGHRRQDSKQTEDEEPLPDAIDLAQSFLETQPSEEKAKLQAALDAEKQDLASSVASSEDGSEDEFSLGTGQPLSLPTFLANFLNGLADRLQITIKGITCQMDVEVPIEPNSTANEPVTFQLQIDEIMAEGVTMQVGETLAESIPKIKHKEGKRYIELNKIRACLISEANVFSALSRSPSIPSSAAASSPVMTSRKPVSRESSAGFTSTPPLRPSMEDSMIFEQSEPHHPLVDTEDAFNIPYDLGSSPGDSGQEDREDLKSAPSTPRALAPQPSPPELPERDNGADPARSLTERQPQSWGSPEPTAKSEPFLGSAGQWEGVATESATSRPGSAHHCTGDADMEADSEPEPSPSDELAQSHLFSHEEAESMYMSAFSGAGSSQSHQAMPGAWDSEPSSPESSPNFRVKTQLASSTSPEAISGFQSASDGSRASASEDKGPAHSPEEAAHPGEAAADEAATPKGPTRLVKELVTLGSISLYLPSSQHQPIPVPSSMQESITAGYAAELNRSVSPNVPGAFSVYGGMQPTSSHSQTSMTSSETPVDKSVEVNLSPLDARIDISTGFLLYMVLSRILTAFKEQSKKPTAKIPTAKKSETSSKSPLPDIKINAQRVSLHFLETLSGVADTPERFLGTKASAFTADALLTTVLQHLTIDISQSQSTTTTSIDLGKFRFGYANEDIVSFNQELQMRASVRDAFPTAGSDLSFKAVQSSQATRCEVKTLPLHVRLDLQRLDETFSWFGGLSGFLNMSSSMTSNTSSTSPTPTQPPKKPRGVRFDAPIRPDDTSASSENKVNARLGGFRLELIGRECSASLDSSAVKIVSREEGIGVGISKIQIAGPYLRHSLGDPPVNAVLTNIRLEYLVTPKDNDLERLLELIIPSKHKFDQNDDEIMVDTLLRQRRKGGVLRVNVENFEVNVSKVQQLQVLPALGEELARLSTVAKYLPEDDRPGILTLVLVRNMDASVDIGGKFGSIHASLKDIEIGHITVPSLVALGVGMVSVRRNHSEELVGSAIPPTEKVGHGPVLTLRIIGDEMEPVIKLRMRHVNFEYRVPTIMDVLDLAEDATPQDFEASLAASVANLGEQAHHAMTGRQPLSPTESGKAKNTDGKPTKVDVVFRDCLLGLNPLGRVSKMQIVLTDAHLEIALSNGDDVNALGHLNKASILLVDDVTLLESGGSSTTSRRRVSNTSTPQIVDLCQRGYVDICYISAAKATIQVGTNSQDSSKWIDVEIRDDLLVLETCADSTQTLITLANALTPPTPPSKEIKYRTNIMPVQDLLASISADAFGGAEGDYDFDNDFGLAQELGGDDDASLDIDEPGSPSSIVVDSRYYDDPTLQEELLDPADSMMSERTAAQDTTDGVLLTNFSSQPAELDDEELIVHDDYFGTGSVILGTAHRWNSAKNAYDDSNNAKVQRSPLTVRVRDVHFIWNLFDGYDWDRTRDVISKAVHDIETTATERQSRSDRARSSTDMEVVEEETVIGDFLFNSIYIGIPANRDPRELAQAINQELNDNATETESVATTMTATPSRQGGAYRSKKRLKLNRSKRHKITFELKGINVDMVNFPPGSGETQSSVDVRVKDLDVFDHVPTSTWKKFATYDQDAGEREMGTSMVHLEILNVKPIATLAASEIVLKATLLPLRLHVDQDALDFITRFFEFKDDSAPVHASPSDIPFVQRAEINSIPVKLDFKPKRVDYAGLKSGHTTEFMNFLVLDQARMVLRHTIIYGISGFERLGQSLNDIWTPDVKKNQLPGVLAGLAPVRSLVNVGSGFKDLVEIPIREYKKDGRIVRSIGKGAAAFAKTTGTEFVKLGAKLAVGTQHALQGAEGILVKQPEVQVGGWEEEDFEDEEPKQISLYADQPTGVVQGLRGAYASLARDLHVARDAIIAVPGEVIQSASAQGAAKVVLKRAPTIVFRPLIGSSKAIGQTLMGATNSLDPQNRRRMDEKYKRH